MKEEENNQYTPIVEEAFSHELKKTEPPTLIQYLRSLRNNQFRKDEFNRIFSKGPVIRDPETSQAYTNPLKLLGDTMDTINDQVSLEKISPMLQFLPEDNTPSVLKDVADYSLKDFQYDAMDFVGEKARENINTGIPNLDKVLVGGAVLGTALMVPDATDVLIPGAADAIKASRKVDWNKLIDWTQETGNSLFNRLTNPNWRAITPDGVEVPNTFFMSKSDDATGGLSDFSKITSPEYENIILSGMERMGMQDGVFDLDLYDLNSGILNAMTDPLGGSMMASGMRRSKKLSKRNWMEYFLSPESLKGNFEALRSQGKLAANLEWEDFLQTKGLTIQDIQSHHINPLYDSIHLFDGVKWGSDEYWEIISELISRGARPGVVQRGDDVTNVIRTLGKSTLTDTPHGVAHEFYRDIMPTFFSRNERTLMKQNHKYRMEKTKRWARIVNRSENVVTEAHKAWEALNPQFRVDFDELVERMAKYTDQGVLEGVHENYQVPDIKNLVKQVQFDEFLERLNIQPVKKKNLPTLVDNQLVDELNQEFLADLASGKTKKELTAKWGKKYNLKAIGAKQLNFFEDIRKIN